MTFALYALAAIAEIAGCFAFWAWLRLDRSPLWLFPGVGLLVLFAWVLTQIDTPAAGRAFAAYGGIYIAASLVWMRLIEGVSTDYWDIAGAALCLAGAGLIFFAPRAAG